MIVLKNKITQSKYKNTPEESNKTTWIQKRSKKYRKQKTTEYTLKIYHKYAIIQRSKNNIKLRKKLLKYTKIHKCPEYNKYKYTKIQKKQKYKN